MVHLVTAAVVAEDMRRPAQKRYMTPHEKMATRRYKQKTTLQKQEDSYNKHVRHEGMRVKAEMNKIVSREKGGDASNNKASPASQRKLQT